MNKMMLLFLVILLILGGILFVFYGGSVRDMENPLNVVIQGSRGFFQVTLADGIIGYTRDGDFRLDETGNIVTSDGFLLDPNIQIPQDATAISISEEGFVTVILPGNQATLMGQIQLADFENPAGLKSIGKNLFTQTEASGNPISSIPGQNGLGSLQQGF